MGRKRTRKVDVRQAQKFAKDYRGCTIAVGGSGSLRGMNRHSRRWYEKVRQRMTDTGVSYADLSARLSERGMETAKSTVGAWMIGRNEPSLAVIKEIGEVLGMSISEIVGEDLYFVRNPLTRQIVERLDGMDDEEKRILMKLLGIEPTEAKSPSK